MPVAKIHVLEGDTMRLVSAGCRTPCKMGLINALGIPPEDFFQIFHILPKDQFLHTRRSLASSTRMI